MCVNSSFAAPAISNINLIYDGKSFGVSGITISDLKSIDDAQGTSFTLPKTVGDVLSLNLAVRSNAIPDITSISKDLGLRIFINGNVCPGKDASTILKSIIGDAAPAKIPLTFIGYDVPKGAEFSDLYLTSLFFNCSDMTRNNSFIGKVIIPTCYEKAYIESFSDFVPIAQNIGTGGLGRLIDTSQSADDQGVMPTDEAVMRFPFFALAIEFEGATKVTPIAFHSTSYAAPVFNFGVDADCTTDIRFNRPVAEDMHGAIMIAKRPSSNPQHVVMCEGCTNKLSSTLQSIESLENNPRNSQSISSVNEYAAVCDGTITFEGSYADTHRGILYTADKKDDNRNRYYIEDGAAKWYFKDDQNEQVLFVNVVPGTQNEIPASVISTITSAPFVHINADKNFIETIDMGSEGEIRTIAANAFAGFRYLENVVVADDVQTIEDGAFNDADVKTVLYV